MCPTCLVALMGTDGQTESKLTTPVMIAIGAAAALGLYLLVSKK